MKQSITKLIRHLNTQIRSAEKVNSDWIYITLEEARKCLELAEAEDIILDSFQNKAKPIVSPGIAGLRYECGSCCGVIGELRDSASLDYFMKDHNFCQHCGKAVDWK